MSCALQRPNCHEKEIPVKTFDRFAVLAAIAIVGSLLLAPASAAQGPTPVTPVYNIDEPGRIPYQATVQQLVLRQQDVVVKFDAVPQGHRLVIQQVSADLDMADSLPPDTKVHVSWFSLKWRSDVLR
jgi:hypothetical protein